MYKLCNTEVDISGEFSDRSRQLARVREVFTDTETVKLVNYTKR
jgi:hypothetical protein